jgi:hypothetical protein
MVAENQTHTVNTVLAVEKPLTEQDTSTRPDDTQKKVEQKELEHSHVKRISRRRRIGTLSVFQKRFEFITFIINWTKLKGGKMSGVKRQEHSVSTPHSEPENSRCRARPGHQNVQISTRSVSATRNQDEKGKRLHCHTSRVSW